MSDLLSPQLRAIEKEVDQYYQKNLLTKIPFCNALWQLLAYYEDKAIFMISKNPKLSIHELGAFVDNIVCELKHPVFWLYSRCPRIGYLDRNFDDDFYQASHDLAELAHQYMGFESIYTYASHGTIDIRLEESTLIASNAIQQDLIYEAYNRLLEQKEKKLGINSSEVMAMITNSISIRGGEFRYQLGKRLMEKMNRSLGELYEDIFKLPNDWNLGNYTIFEFRQMFKTISSMSMIHFLARNIAAQNGCQGLGFNNCLLRFTRKDLLWKIIQYSNVEKVSAENFIDDLTYGSNGIIFPDPALQPLFNTHDDNYLIMPNLILGSAAERNLVTLMNRIPDKRSIYLNLVNDKEKWLQTKLHEGIINPNLRFFKGYIPGYPELPDIDYAIIDDIEKIVFFIELKWFIGPSEPREVLEKSAEIKKGISQSIKLKTAFSINTNIFNKLLNINESFQPYFLVLSENFIGLGIFQNNEIPVLEVGHFIRKLNQVRRTSEIIPWLRNRNYLPKENKDFKIIDEIFQIGKWKCKWYGLEPLIKSEYL